MDSKRKPGRPTLKGTHEGAQSPKRNLRVPDSDWQLWREIAQEDGLTLSQWIRTNLGQIAKRAARTLKRG